MDARSTTLAWNNPAPNDRARFDPQIVFEAGLRHHHIANTAYPIHHGTTMRPYRVPGLQSEAVIRSAWQHVDRLGLYVHVPFCAVRCRYCEYTVAQDNGEEAQQAYVDALVKEFQLYRERLDTTEKAVIGFDIGGGTPASIAPAHIRRILRAARSSFRFSSQPGISIETTPIIAARQPDKIRAYKEMGIDRISMGVQTTHIQLARSLGREIDGPHMIEKAVCNIRNSGYRRFNIDLMYGFADQSPESWQQSVQQTIALGPEYITLYQVRFKGTQIREQAARVTRRQVNALRRIAKDLLLAAGYAGTPGKNTYSRIESDPGTSDYLTERVVKGTPYLGFGLGAQSLSHHTLSYNLGARTKTLEPYMQAVNAGALPIQDAYHLPLSAAMGKMISVSFYFGQIHLAHFSAKFDVQLQERFGPEVAFVLDNGLMEYAGPYLRLTPRGVDCRNGVIALFYASAVKEYLVHLEPSLSTPSIKAA
jgi:coproporphyrinogen III oxidase-like Fe-S oxidoreductase